MEKILFLNDNETIYDCHMFFIGNNVIEIDFITTPPSDNILTSGFDLLNEHNGVVQGEYHDYTTIYRAFDDNQKKIELSNDGSTYVPPKPPTPPTPPLPPTLEEVKESKIVETNDEQQLTIQHGVDITLSDGTVEHFTLTDHDQLSLMGLQTRVLAGDAQIPWHIGDQEKHCKYYSNKDMQLITTAAMQFVMFHVTYYRDLRIYIRSLQSIDEVNAVTYGMDIPEEFQSEPLKDMLKAANE